MSANGRPFTFSVSEEKIRMLRHTIPAMAVCVKPDPGDSQTRENLGE